MATVGEADVRPDCVGAPEEMGSVVRLRRTHWGGIERQAIVEGAKMDGATWHRWDLHIHTPASFQHSFRIPAGSTNGPRSQALWDAYVDALEADTAVRAIGITDYFDIEGYEQVLEYRKRGRLQDFDLILPNIEFRLDSLFVGPKKRPVSVNYHVIFSNDLEADVIRREFLEQLQFTTSQNESRSLSKQNIEAVGRELKKHQAEFKGMSDYKAGCINIKVSVRDIRQVLTSRGNLFEGKYLTVLALDGFTLEHWKGQAHLAWKALFNGADAVFTANPQTRQLLLGQLHPSKEDYLNEFEAFKPCIHGSDAHDFDRLFLPDEKRYCWIKGELTFAGLRQIKFEPEDRVRIAEEQPDQGRFSFSVRSFQLEHTFINPQLALDDKPIHLNPALVSVIGGKGNGKTALLDLIAHCFESRHKDDIGRAGSFVSRIAPDNEKLGITLEFLNGESWQKRLGSSEVFGRSRITYLPQGSIDEFSSDTEKLHNMITDLVFANHAVRQSELEDRYRELKRDVDSTLSQISSDLAQVDEAERETGDDVRAGLVKDLEEARGRVADLQHQLEKHSLPDDLRERAEQLDARIGQFDDRIAAIESLSNKLSRLKNDVENVHDVNATAASIGEELKQLGWDEPLPQIDVSSLALAIEHVQDFLEKTQESEQRDVDLLRAEKDGFEETQRDHADMLEQIGVEKEREAELEEGIDRLDERRQETATLLEACKTSFLSTLKSLHRRRETYDEIIRVFAENKDQMLDVIDFRAVVKFDSTGFAEAADDLFHGRSVSDDDIRKMVNAFERLGNQPDDETVAATYFELVLGSASKVKRTRSRVDLYRLMLRPSFDLETEVLFDDKPLSQLSMGQKGTVLLTLVLSEGTHPLVLDQPEENLDNRFVYEVLVRAIRAAKQRRQIIMATHNANLVVNTDSEQVIVAHYEDGKITYESGALEQPHIRQEVTTLLEGGEQAFNQREQRYRG